MPVADHILCLQGAVFGFALGFLLLFAVYHHG